jgi:nitroreductase
MDFYEVINQRESIRNYDPLKPLTKEVYTRILEAGRVAPSAANKQPWRFLLISSPEMLAKVRPCYDWGAWFLEAPHVLVVEGNRQQAWVRPWDKYNSLETDLTIAMDHMVLAAENEGVGTCWIAAFKPDILRNALRLQENEIVYAITPLGYPKEGFKKKMAKQRKPFNEVVQIL